MAETKPSHGELQPVVASGFHDQADSRVAIHLLVGSASHSSVAVRLGARLAAHEHSMSDASRANHARMVEVHARLRCQFEAFPNCFEKQSPMRKHPNVSAIYGLPIVT